MQDDGGQVSRQHQKVYTYWVDDDVRYIGLCLRYNRYLTDSIFLLIAIGQYLVVGDSLHMFILSFLLVLITIVLYSQFLKRTAMYYLLDERGTPTEFLSSQKPESIRRARPLTRKQFLRRVGEGTAGTQA